MRLPGSARVRARAQPGRGVWRQAKQRLANAGPAGRFALAFTLLDELNEALRRSPDRLWSCIAHSGLTLWCALTLRCLRGSQ
jgi:hypothetical protein